MADTELTGLPAASTLADADLLYVVDDVAGTPTSKKLTGADLKTAAGGGGGTSQRDLAVITARDVIAWDDFDGASGTALAGRAAPSGQTWTEHVGSWELKGSNLVGQKSADGNPMLATIDVGIDDYVVECTIFNDNIIRPGLVVRFVDVDNCVEIAGNATNGYVIYARVAGSSSVVGTGTGVDVAGTGERRRVRVAVSGEHIAVLTDGVATRLHTFTGGEMTAFGAGTRVGLRHISDAPTRWSDFVVYRGVL